jgi:hypothetical protein
MYRVGVRSSVLLLPTESDMRGEREEIALPGIIEARFVFFSHGASDLGQIVTIGEKPRLFSVSEITVFYKLESNPGILN